METLAALRPGQKGRIVAVEGDDAVALRLLEMGLTEGEEVSMLGYAPLGDPIEFSVRGYRVSLRGAEAERVHVELVGPAEAVE
ncbi:MAG TPA: ferrous iron transport protein A [Planctomycetaceae bacterium]